MQLENGVLSANGFFGIAKKIDAFTVNLVPQAVKPVAKKTNNLISQIGQETVSKAVEIKQ